MSLKVLALTRHGRLGSSSRLRIMQFVSTLQEKGIDVEVASMLSDAYLQALYRGGEYRPHAAFSYFRRAGQLLSSAKYDVLWIEKEVFPWLPAFIELGLVGHKPWVLDYDDATFHSYDQHPNQLFRKWCGNKIDVLMAHATVVTVGNSYLAQRAISAGAKDVRLLPTVVDLARYRVASTKIKTQPVIGWIGAPATEKYLLAIAEPLAIVCQNTGAVVRLVGVSKDFSLLNVPIEIREWSEESECQEIQEFDVGIMPLPDEPWAQGKCGYKLIQYMACAKPIVASPVGVNIDIVRGGVNGFAATNSQEWQDALEILVQQTDLAERMGRQGRLLVEQQYSLTVVANLITSALLAAADKRV